MVEFSRETEPKAIKRSKRFIIGISSCSYGGQEVPLPAICSWRPRRASGIIYSESKGSRSRSTAGSMFQLKESELAFLCLFLSRPSVDRQCPSTLVRVIFAQTTYSNAMFSGNTLPDIPRDVLSAIWAALGPLKWMCKMNPHDTYMFWYL